MNEQSILQESQSGKESLGNERFPFPELLTAEDMCQIFGISRAVLWDWRVNKGLPHITLGRKYFFIESQVWEWLKSLAKEIER